MGALGRQQGGHDGGRDLAGMVMGRAAAVAEAIPAAVAEAVEALVAGLAADAELAAEGGEADRSLLPGGDEADLLVRHAGVLPGQRFPPGADAPHDDGKVLPMS